MVEFLYPEIQPYTTGYLEVSNIHKLYYEECGKKNGVPIVFLHGGPGGGIGERDRRFFDPNHYKIILFDQRGSGKSEPSYCLEENDTWSIVKDLEKLREHVGVEKWLVFGGSWGSTLALAYAEKHPTRVIALILRGIFTLRKEELQWFYQSGASYIFPDIWETYLEPIPETERDDLISAYYKRLTGKDEKLMITCAKAWSKWEMCTSRLKIDQDMVKKIENDTWALSFARIECHFFKNNGFFKENELLNNAKILIDHKIPLSIVQGRYDVVCPAKTAWELHKKVPHSELFIIEDAGHSAKEESTTKKLVEICDKYKNLK